MLYVKLDKRGNPCEYPITEISLRRRMVGVSLPKKITKETLDLIGYAEVPESKAPERLEGHATVPDVPVRSEDGTIQRTYRYVPYTKEGLEKRKNELRVKRNRLLAGTDWTQTQDVQSNMTAEQRNEWSEYRSALRNMTDDYSDPNMAVYPAMPDFPTLAEVNTQSPIDVVKRKIAAQREDVQSAGLSYEFPDGKIGTIQTRDEGDTVNILGQALIAMSMMTDDDGESPTLPFRDAENVTHDLTPQQMLLLATTTLNYISSVRQKKWELERQFAEMVNEGATKEEMEAFGNSLEWTSDESC